MSYKLDKPFTDKQRADFIVKYNHKQGLTIQETETAVYALQPWEILQGDNVIDNTEAYEQEQAQKEAERIAMLNLTGADVERGIYKAKGMDFEDIISYLEAMPLSEGTPQIDIKALKIELKANFFYRGNPYVEQIGMILGFTSKQLNKFFEAGTSEDLEEKANAYKYLTTVFFTVNPTPSDCKVVINGTEQDSVTVPYGEEVSYEVSKKGYITKTDTITILEDTILNISLVEETEDEETV